MQATRTTIGAAALVATGGGLAVAALTGEPAAKVAPLSASGVPTVEVRTETVKRVVHVTRLRRTNRAPAAPASSTAIAPVSNSARGTQTVDDSETGDENSQQPVATIPVQPSAEQALPPRQPAEPLRTRVSGSPGASPAPGYGEGDREGYEEGYRYGEGDIDD